MSIFLAHYDGSQGWYAATFPSWYPRIWRSVNYTDFKASYVRRELVADPITANAVVQDFSHVWVVDDDLRFPSLERTAAFLDAVRLHDTLIAQPAVRGSWQTLVTPEQRRKLGSGCTAWSSDFVLAQRSIHDLMSRQSKKSRRSKLWRPS